MCKKCNDRLNYKSLYLNTFFFLPEKMLNRKHLRFDPGSLPGEHIIHSIVILGRK